MARHAEAPPLAAAPDATALRTLNRTGPGRWKDALHTAITQMPRDLLPEDLDMTARQLLFREEARDKIRRSAGMPER